MKPAATTARDATPGLRPIEESVLLSLPLVFAILITEDQIANLNPVFALLARGAVLLGLGLTFLPGRPVGRRVPLALGLVSIIACETSFRTLASIPACLGYLFGSLFLLEWLDREGAPRRPDARALTIALLLVACSLAVARPIEQQVASTTSRVQQDLAEWLRERMIGFEVSPMSLGELQGVYESRRIALRIDGPIPRRLRGHVLPRFRQLQWIGTSAERQGTLEDALPAGATRVEIARKGMPAIPLPIDVDLVRVEPPGVAFADGGVVRSLPNSSPESYSFTTASWDGERSGKFVHDRPTELEIDPFAGDDSLVRVLEDKASAWTHPGMGPREKMQSITDRLSEDYSYSLDFEWNRDLHPMVDFLTHREDGAGHCEYFASALALVGRQAGVPTRVVTGYHVSEINPLGNYAIVRERDAHAWVEAWITGEGWVEFDPSPAPRFASEPSWSNPITMLVDAARRAIPKLQRTEVLVAIALAALIVIGLRWLLRQPWFRIVRPSRGPTDRGLRDLERALARRGLARDPALPLERFAAEVHGVDPAASALLERCGARIYGPHSDDDLDEDVQSWVRLTAKSASGSAALRRS